MVSFKKKRALDAIKASICNSILGSNSDLSFLERIRQPGKLTQIMSFLGSALKKAEQENARRFLADMFAAEIVQIADNDNEEPSTGSTRDTVARAKLRIETRRWLMEQFAPNIYGSGKTMRGDTRGTAFRTKAYLPENGRP